MRALRPGGQTMIALQRTLLAFIDKSACDVVPFWSMATASVESIRERVRRIVAAANVTAEVVDVESVPGAGSTPGAVIPSAGLSLPGDHVAAMRSLRPPVIARRDGASTVFDLRSVSPADDDIVAASLASLG